MKKEGLFEQLILDLTMDQTELIELLGDDAGKNTGIPGRLAILAEAFAKGWNTDRVNQELLDNEYETLYARSLFEASLIYAYDHGIDYQGWKGLLEECRTVYENEKEDSVFNGKVTLKQLKSYIFSESSESLETEFLTRWMESSIQKQESLEEFQMFMKDNIAKFSGVREKARYYFCKYLYLYIHNRCQNYYDSCEKSEQVRRQYGNALRGEEKGIQEKFALEELSFLKPLTKLKKEAEKIKPSMTPEEKKAYLEETSLTPGGIFDEFNFFYFGYVSADWVEVLFELYGEFAQWPMQTKLKIARSLDLCPMNPSEEEKRSALEKLSVMAKEQEKKEQELDDIHVRDEKAKKKSYQRGRVGEDYFRDFILGKRDINRATLITFLMFVKSDTKLEDDDKITVPRVNRILMNCGFPQLRPDREFDSFVMRYLKSKEPMDILEEEVEKQVVMGKNFYLYKVYQDAYCHQNELLEYLV